MMGMVLEMNGKWYGREEKKGIKMWRRGDETTQGKLWVAGMENGVVISEVFAWEWR